MAMQSAVHNDQLIFSSEELLSNGDYSEPLIANGVLCHGGFDESGAYRSPRTLFRAPAIEAWQAQLHEAGAELIDIPRSLMPPQYPNVDQAVMLLREGVRDPIVRALTVISIVEGFGAIIRDVKVPDLASLLVEPIEGTALAHLSNGLFEAHARDEAGHRDQGGHKQMWEAARDTAFENPSIPGDVLMRVMGRRQRRGERRRPFPEIDEGLERMLQTMTTVLVIEVFAEGTFEWGKQLLGNPEVSAQPEAAGGMVGYIQGDEKPHVEYLRTALSELRARTIRRVDGKTITGRRVIDGMLHATLENMTRSRPKEQQEEARRGVEDAFKTARSPDRLVEEFDALATKWTPPAQTGFEEGAEVGRETPS